MTRTEILETYWEEYLEFIRQLSKELKAKEKDMKSTDFMSMMLEPEKFAQTEQLKMIAEIGENSFWTWYLYIKTAPSTQAKGGKNSE